VSSLLDAAVVEHAVLHVDPAASAAFTAAMREAMPIIAAADGFAGARLLQVSETPGRYVLLVGWVSQSAHTDGFRTSAGYQRWRELLHGFYVTTPPLVEHAVVVAGAEGP